MRSSVSSDVEGNAYPRLLLERAQAELEALRRRHEEGQLTHVEYNNCRCALLDTITTLRTIIGTKP